MLFFSQEMRHLLTTVGEKLTDYEAEELLKNSGCVQQGRVNYESELKPSIFHALFFRSKLPNL